jgi:predicted  nucleic acid-binding Zn-ribbon protein
MSTMKNQLNLLRQLQELDLRRDALLDGVDQERDKLSEHAEALERLEAGLDEQRKHLDETLKLRSSKTVELKENQERYNHANEKFRNANNSREYAAAEREVETYKAIVTQFEEDITRLTKAIQESELTVNDAHSRISALRADYDAALATLSKKDDAANDSAKTFDSQIATLGKSIPRMIYQRYKFIRDRRGGTAIIAASDGACQGCFMRLPPQVYIQLQRGQTLETCQNCQRILFFEEKKDNDEASP